MCNNYWTGEIIDCKVINRKLSMKEAMKEMTK